ncbi:MAG: hypothetical protein SFZ03_01655 [Candidatus Melainabacteria bacterium]|nr:hypothetical protein [Candidatus Melainabacteria bacterium]
MSASAYAFGTSGYRSNTEAGFNESVVRQITHAIADYLIEQMHQNGLAKPVLIGGDTREKSQQFIPHIAQWLVEKGLDVYQTQGEVPTPVLAYAAAFFEQYEQPHMACAGAILMTASHNPWDYGGYNFLTPDGAVAPASMSAEFERLQQSPLNLTLNRKKLGLQEPASIRTFDPYSPYAAHLKENLDLDYETIRESGVAILYDPMYATGRRFFPRLLQEEGLAIDVLNDTDQRPAHYEGMPNPGQTALAELSSQVQAMGRQTELVLGLANDGDADRFGVMDEAGRYLSPNDVLLLTLYHLVNHRRQKGAVVRSQATSHALDALAARYRLPVIQTPVGYKYIAETFIEHQQAGKTPVLLGGESSGGLSIQGHIPEKDGLLANLLMVEMVAQAEKPLGKLLEKIKSEIGAHYRFEELSIKTEAGPTILSDFAQYRQGNETAPTPLRVDLAKTQKAAKTLENHYGTTDGVKLYLEGGHWLLVRASGTEPLVRFYLEATGPSEEAAQDILAEHRQTIVDLLATKYAVRPEAIAVKH